MKKILLAFALLFGLASTACAKDSYSRDESILPQAARTTISNNFKSKISLIKTEKTVGTVTEYEVILTDGSEISFDKNGNWDEVDVPRGKEVPSGFIIKGIKEYVNQNHSGQKIESIDKERSGYDIELSNGIDLKFDKDGKFIRYDD